MYPFWNFFGIATDTTLVWTLFGFLWARMHALHGHSRLARGTRIAAIVMVSVEAVIVRQIPPLTIEAEAQRLTDVATGTCVRNCVLHLCRERARPQCQC